MGLALDRSAVYQSSHDRRRADHGRRFNRTRARCDFCVTFPSLFRTNNPHSRPALQIRARVLREPIVVAAQLLVEVPIPLVDVVHSLLVVATHQHNHHYPQGAALAELAVLLVLLLLSLHQAVDRLFGELRIAAVIEKAVVVLLCLRG